jgi:hypothetical protein
MKNIIVTMEINDTGDKNKDPYDDVCRVARIKYAKKINCDYYSIKTNKMSPLLWNKFQTYDVMNGYNKCLFIDADILITPHCPNVFECIDTGVGLVSDYWNFNAGGYTVYSRENFNLNSGFILCCSDSIEYFNKDTHINEVKPSNWDTDFEGACSDQTYFRYKLKNSDIKFTQLSEIWNYNPYFNDYAKSWEEAKIKRKQSGMTRYNANMIHYTLLKKLMKYDYDYMYNSVGTPLMFEDIDKI